MPEHILRKITEMAVPSQCFVPVKFNFGIRIFYVLGGSKELVKIMKDRKCFLSFMEIIGSESWRDLRSVLCCSRNLEMLKFANEIKSLELDKIYVSFE